MSQENETEKYVTGTSALTEVELAEVVASLVMHTFPSFEASAEVAL
jgi:hypothetical protein